MFYFVSDIAGENDAETLEEEHDDTGADDDENRVNGDLQTPGFIFGYVGLCSTPPERKCLFLMLILTVSWRSRLKRAPHSSTACARACAPAVGRARNFLDAIEQSVAVAPRAPRGDLREHVARQADDAY